MVWVKVFNMNKKRRLAKWKMMNFMNFLYVLKKNIISSCWKQDSTFFTGTFMLKPIHTCYNVFPSFIIYWENMSLLSKRILFLYAHLSIYIYKIYDNQNTYVAKNKSNETFLRSSVRETIKSN